MACHLAVSAEPGDGMGSEVVVLAAIFALTGRGEISQAIDAQYGIGPAVELYVRQNTPNELWHLGATAGPLVQFAATRRVSLRWAF